MTEFETASLAMQQAAVTAAYIVGLVQCGLIGWGLWLMSRSNASRDATLTALERQGEALRAQGAVLAEIGAGIREQSAGIRELLRDRGR